VIDVGEAKVARLRRGGKGGSAKGSTTRFFSVACGVGFDADVMEATAKSRKRRLGKLAYLATAVGQQDKLRNEQHQITIDGTARTGMATQVFVANFGKMGLPFEPQLEIVPDDAQFDVIILRAEGAVEGLVAGWAAIRQRRRGHASNGRVFRTHARSVLIAADHPRLVELDGSVIGTTPVDVSIRPAALSVIVPAD
jgi:diacylglycerol kinase family enzyme